MATSAEALARRFVEARGYAVGAVPEATVIERGADHVLTKSDGLTFSIVAIVDAEGDANRRFEVEPAEVRTVLAACCDRYGGVLGGAKQPAVLVVVEVRADADPTARDRLRAYSNKTFDQNAVHAFVVDVGRGAVTTATKFSFLAGWGWRRFLVKEARRLG